MLIETHRTGRQLAVLPAHDLVRAQVVRPEAEALEASSVGAHARLVLGAGGGPPKVVMGLHGHHQLVHVGGGDAVGCEGRGEGLPSGQLARHEA